MWRPSFEAVPEKISRLGSSDVVVMFVAAQKEWRASRTYADSPSGRHPTCCVVARGASVLCRWGLLSQEPLVGGSAIPLQAARAHHANTTLWCAAADGIASNALFPFGRARHALQHGAGSVVGAGRTRVGIVIGNVLSQIVRGARARAGAVSAGCRITRARLLAHGVEAAGGAAGLRARSAGLRVCRSAVRVSVASWAHVGGARCAARARCAALGCGATL